MSHEHTTNAPAAGLPAWAAHLPAGSNPGDVDLLRDGTLVRAWNDRWAEAPGHPTLHTDAGGWMTAGDLERATRRVAGRFHQAGLRAGDRVLMSAASSADLVVAHVGALRLGLVVVPANTAYREREIAHLVRDAAPRAAVVDAADRAGWIRSVDGDVTVVGPDIDLPDGPARVPNLDGAKPGDAAVIGYTSGTTGAPKGAVQSHANLLASAAALRIAWRWTAADRLVLALPLFHAHGLAVGLHGTLLAGGSAVLRPGFDADDVLDAARTHAATLFFGVPTMYARLAASARVGELGALRLCVSGSAPLAPALFARIAETGHQRVLERYGMTETLMNVSNPYDGERRPGSVGFPLPGVEVRLDGGEAEGEILLRGPNVFAGYWRNGEATAAAFTADGWFRSGDLGRIDADGYLHIVGRSKDLIITGGFNVYPREVEDVLLGHASVADVAVAGTPSDEWGETVTAYVVPVDGRNIDVDDLLAFASERLAPFKRPRLVHIVSALPKNALGKVLRHELRAPS